MCVGDLKKKNITRIVLAFVTWKRVENEARAMIEPALCVWVLWEKSNNDEAASSLQPRTQCSALSAGLWAHTVTFIPSSNLGLYVFNPLGLSSWKCSIHS